jgi:hypothetical protein
MLDVEQTAEARPQGGRKLGPLSDVMVAGTPNRETQLHIVYIFNILCGLKVISSRRLQ